MHARYVLRHLVARGGMAEVYLGTLQGEDAASTPRPVIIKRVHPHLAQDPRIAKMFTAEAQTAAQLHHPNLVEVLDVGSGPDGLYLVLELVNGWDLGIILEAAQKKRRVLAPRLATYVTAQVVSGLAHAYAKQMDGRPLIHAHRDVSPPNVLVSTAGEVKVADFGVARGQLASGTTEPGTFKGKVAYAAPEQLRGELTNAASDQFSLGIVLHEMLTGLSPFGSCENLIEYVQKLERDHLFPLSGVPEPLARIVRTMLARDPKQRFPTADVLLRALKEYLASSGPPVNSLELQAFLATLELPPPISDASKPLGPVHDGDTFVRQAFSLAAEPAPPSAPAAPPTPMLGPPPPGGPVGAFSGSPPLPSRPPHEAHGSTLELNGALARPQAARPAALEEASSTPTLELVSLPKRTVSRPMPAVTRRAPRPAPVMATKLGAVGLFAMLVALVAVWIVVSPSVRQKVERAIGIASSRVNGTQTLLHVSSEPAGASVTIDGAPMGFTPFSGDNRDAARDHDVEVTLQGYRAWRAKVHGGEDVTLDAHLESL